MVCRACCGRWCGWSLRAASPKKLEKGAIVARLTPAVTPQASTAAPMKIKMVAILVKRDGCVKEVIGQKR